MELSQRGAGAVEEAADSGGLGSCGFLEMAVFGDIFNIFVNIFDLVGEPIGDIFSVFLDVAKKFGDFQG